MRKYSVKLLTAWVAVLFVGCMGGGSAPSDIRPAGSESSGVQIFRGVITANQIDISADDGSLLPERLNVGDEVYIIYSPQGGSRQGWVRVSRSADDTTGIGWVERKSVRSYGRYKSADGSSPATVDSSIPIPGDVPLPPPTDASPLGDLPIPSDPVPMAPPAGGTDLPPIDQAPVEPIPDGSLPTGEDPLLLLPPG